MEWTALLTLVIGGLISWFLRPFSDSYIREKAKNLATKEDIEEITRKVEEIKGDVITGIELLKWDLGKKSTVHRLAAEYQFKALAEIGATLFELSQATRKLRPIIDYYDPDESAQARNQKRYNEWVSGHNLFFQCVEKHRLFLPEALHKKFENIRMISINEASSFRAVSDEEIMQPKDYQVAMDNIKALEESIQSAINAIQEKYLLIEEESQISKTSLIKKD
jgi:hypothetical protein